MSEFLAMSGYGGYRLVLLWPDAAIVLVANVWAARRRLREEIVHAKRRRSRAGGRRGIMTPRRRRMVLVGLIVARRGRGGVRFALTAFQDNLLYYYTPATSAAGKAPMRPRVPRSAAWCDEGSFNRPTRAVWKRASSSPISRRRHVSYTGVLPDLFREGQGIIARGRLGAERSVRRRGSAREARRELHAARRRREPAQAARDSGATAATSRRT